MDLRLQAEKVSHGTAVTDSIRTPPVCDMRCYFGIKAKLRWQGETAAWVHITDIQGRSHTLYTAPYNSTVRYGAQIGDLCIFADNTSKANAN